MRAGRLNRKLRIERPEADAGVDGAGSGSWVHVATVWAEVQDVLPSKAESEDTGITLSIRRARVRMRWRADITADMRFVMEQPAGEPRVMHVVSGPVEMGWRDALELMIEDYSSSGNAA